MPPDGVKSIFPFAVPHRELVTTNSPFTPALICIDGNVPHLGEIVAGSNGQILPGEASVHAKNKLVIFKVLPQVYETLYNSKAVTTLPGSGPPQPVIGFVETNEPVIPLYSSKFPQKAKDVLVEPVVLSMDNVNVLSRVVFWGHELHKSPSVRVAPTNSRS